ncbi:MAG: sensor histidine kinase N-terminal domain-containing protein [Rhodocyclales bacterium]|nr:sensor histidine kinase N-terminal domain-containing protein [Rhodocyclales bacterium]
MIARPLSLRLRLISLTLLAVGTVWLAAAAFTYREARHAVDELLDAHLAQAAAILVAQSLHELHEEEVLQTPLLHHYARKVAFQAYTANGELRLSSANAPQVPLGSNAPGFAEREIEGRRWRVFSTTVPEHQLMIHVGEIDETRGAVAQELIMHLLQPLLFALPLLALLLAFAVRRALMPLAGVTRELATRAADNLAPLSLAATPAEIAPLVSRMNELFAGITRALDNERRFTADAAHELRTPLAALKAQTQVAQAAASEAERQHALQKIVASCDRATHLVEQMLTLARLDASTPQALQPVALRPLAEDVLSALAGEAVARDCDLVLKEGEATIAGNPVLLRVLLRNLADNALRHAGALHVEVAIVTAGNETVLSVADDGRGVSAIERERLGQRFHRLASADFSSGSGLGLSIVRRIAELHRARLEFHPGLGGRGMAVHICFAAAA